MSGQRQAERRVDPAEAGNSGGGGSTTASDVAARPLGRRVALRAALAGALGAAGALIAGGSRPEPAAALAGPIEYSSSGTTPTIQGDNAGNPGIGVAGTSGGGSVPVENAGVVGVYQGLGGYGVFGISNGDTGAGVRGSCSAAGAGVHADSSDGAGYAIYAVQSGNAGYVISAVNQGSGGVGVLATGGATGVAATGSVVGVTGTGINGVSGIGSSVGVTASGPTGVYGTGTTYGVAGTTSTAGASGIYGANTAASGFGVLGSGATGVSGSSTSGTGVLGSGATGVSGQGTSTGILGTAGNAAVPNGANAGVLGAGPNTGVLGLTSSTTAAAVEGDGVTVGVQGVSTTTGTNTGYGVKGVANAGPGSAGVLGYAPNGLGYGFYGYSTASGGAGALAYNTTTGGSGLIAFNAGAGPGYAAIFGSATPQSGNVLVRGTLTTLNSAPSVAARDSSGSLRRFYGVQSPESWFEDFGSGQLSGGSATVQLDPAFAAVVDTSDYHVFLTPEGGWSSLYVATKGAASFTVRDAGGGDTGAKPGSGGGGAPGASFSYRIVAKRNDVASARLERVAEPPAVTAPEIPEIAPASKPS